MQTLTSVNIRKRLLQLFQQLLMDIRGDVLVARTLQSELEPLRAEKILLLATGKAAASMARGAVQVLGDRIVDARIITKVGHCPELEQDTGMCCREAGHPLPDAQSLAAGEELVNWLSSLSEDASLLILTSGGTSALVEKLPATSSLENLVRLNTWLLASGLDIHAVNQIRQSVSCIKGGGLLACVSPAIPITHLILSDVAGDDPAIIGSGLFVATKLATGKESPPLPDWIQRMQQAAVGCRAYSKKTAQSRVHIIASNTMACRTLANSAVAMGMTTHLHDEPLEGDAVVQAQIIARYLREQAEAGLHIWGGETTVTLPAQPGRGGRNQHLALAVALELAGTSGITLLVAGTDGSDGPTDDAGALIDGRTLMRGEAEGLDARLALQQADAGSFLAAAGDLLSSGMTGTNVMDIVLAFKQNTDPENQ